MTKGVAVDMWCAALSLCSARLYSLHGRACSMNGAAAQHSDSAGNTCYSLGRRALWSASQCKQRERKGLACHKSRLRTALACLLRLSCPCRQPIQHPPHIQPNGFNLLAVMALMGGGSRFNVLRISLWQQKHQWLQHSSSAVALMVTWQLLCGHALFVLCHICIMCKTIQHICVSEVVCMTRECDTY